MIRPIPVRLPIPIPFFRGRFLAAAVVAAAFATPVGLRSAHAQELVAQPTPLTAWIDLRPAAPEADPQTAPTWVEAFEYVPAKTAADAVETVSVSIASATAIDQSMTDGGDSVYRVRLHRPAASVSDLQVRLFYDDREGDGRPHVSVWNELGEELMRSDPLGQGLGLPSSDTLVVPMEGADYLEFAAPGDGSQLRAVFLTWLQKSEIQQPADFVSPDTVKEPFQILSAIRTPRDDGYLYGVVTARLQGGKAVALKAADVPATTFEFQLERQPLVAVVSYEVLGSTLNASPTITVNQAPAVASEVYLPDLSDPGYRGETHDGDARMGFRYTGWVHAQKVIPGETLTAGLNSLTVSLSKGSDAVAIRSVQIQLKYNWEKLDYILSPALTPLPDSYDAP